PVHMVLVGGQVHDARADGTDLRKAAAVEPRLPEIAAAKVVEPARVREHAAVHGGGDEGLGVAVISVDRDAADARPVAPVHVAVEHGDAGEPGAGDDLGRATALGSANELRGAVRVGEVDMALVLAETRVNVLDLKTEAQG